MRERRQERVRDRVALGTQPRHDAPLQLGHPHLLQRRHLARRHGRVVDRARTAGRARTATLLGEEQLQHVGLLLELEAAQLVALVLVEAG